MMRVVGNQSINHHSMSEKSNLFYSPNNSPKWCDLVNNIACCQKTKNPENQRLAGFWQVLIPVPGGEGGIRTRLCILLIFS